MDVNLESQPDALPWRSVYKLLTGAIVPRPIGWISSIDGQGRPNLAPFSFFNVVSANPPHVLFCPGVRESNGMAKDTLYNVHETGEFVVNIVTEDLAEAMNITAADVPPGEDEFALAGLTPASSYAVRAPRVAESPIHFECRLSQIVEISDQPGGGRIVIGRVVHIHVEDEFLIGSDKIDIPKLRPIGRLAGAAYTRVNDVFELQRPSSRIKPRS